ncbi:hypothetical protein [Streptomyces cavernae]|uniref:Rv1733c family protein n=1 Tax=Streptomyces cavernae TaxID=2259034 RepID=UPI000FEBC334|nr:hypothetical protein [Streptomyces cavernae]
MVAFRGPKVWLWRWRRNSLRRRSDRMEAWVGLGVWALILLVGMGAGLWAEHSVESSLARQRAEWHPVSALLAENAPPADDKAAASGERVWVKVGWTADDGTEHTGQTRVAPGSMAGSAVSIWTDREGFLVSRPASASQAQLRASMVGVLVGVSAAALPWGGGRFVRGRLYQRRLEEWDEAWARVEPQWRRKAG